MSRPAVQPLRPAAKIGIVLGGLVVALAAAWATMEIRQRLNADDPSQGMQAFGDLIMGGAVFSVLATIPAGCALYWLRPIARFWNVLINVAIACSLTGPLAVLISGPFRTAAGNWALLGDLRFVTLPVSSLAWATCTLFAPTVRHRWLFLAAALIDGLLFVGVLVVKFILPQGR
jgi:hypothetical protein